MTFAPFFSVLSQNGFWRFGLSGRRTACAMEIGRKVASNHCNLTRDSYAALVDDPPSTFRPTSCRWIRFMPTLHLPTRAATVGTRDEGGCGQRQPMPGRGPLLLRAGWPIDRRPTARICFTQPSQWDRDMSVGPGRSGVHRGQRASRRSAGSLCCPGISRKRGLVT